MCRVLRDNQLRLPAPPRGTRSQQRRDGTGIMGKNCNPIFSDMLPAWYGDPQTQVNQHTNI
jgi:hypothetical protein